MIKLNKNSVYIIHGQYLCVGARFKRCFKDNELILNIINCPNARTLYCEAWVQLPSHIRAQNNILYLNVCDIDEVVDIFVKTNSEYF